jgi:hypothetical protein
MELTDKEKELKRSLENRKGFIDEFVLHPELGSTIITKDNNRAIIRSLGDSLEFDGIREIVYDSFYAKYIER